MLDLLSDQGKESNLLNRQFQGEVLSRGSNFFKEQLLTCLCPISVGYALLLYFKKQYAHKEGRSIGKYRFLHTDCYVTLGIDSDLILCKSSMHTLHPVSAVAYMKTSLGIFPVTK